MFASKHKDLSGLEQRSKGVVIIRNYTIESSYSKPGLQESRCNLKTEWRNEEIGTSLKVDTCRLWNLFDSPKDEFEVYFVPPGTYSLDSATADMGCFMGACTKRTATKLHNLATFQVRPGEVVYVGDLAVLPYGQVRYSLNVLDNYSIAKRYFKERYPDIGLEPVKRLIRFLPGVQGAYTKDNTTFASTN